MDHSLGTRNSLLQAIQKLERGEKVVTEEHLRNIFNTGGGVTSIAKHLPNRPKLMGRHRVDTLKPLYEMFWRESLKQNAFK